MEVLVIHIQKTAGVSLWGAIRHIYGDDAKHAFDYFGPHHEDARPRLYNDYRAFKQEWDQAMGTVPEDVRVLQDHTPVSLYDGLFPEAKRITFVRHPADRVVSSYLHNRGKGHIPGKMSIQEFIRDPEWQNEQTFYTGGDLSQFAFVGVTEYFNEEIHRLAKVLGWPSGYPVAHVNKTANTSAKKAHLSDHDLVQDIVFHNKLDLSLFHEAVMREDPSSP